MSNFNIIKESTITDTFRTNMVKSIFDISTDKIKEVFSGNIELENKDWNIGIIFGNSGTGKSTIAKELFKNNYIKEYKYNATSIIDDMPKEKEVKEIIKTFNAVGFSSPLSWLKPYDVLSNGEKMRTDLARAILEQKDLICFDEFTSVVNREIAKIGSYAIQKTIRKLNKKFVAVSCHDDIIEWLEPDWIFNTNDMSFFLAKNIKHQKSNVKYINVTENFGNFLKNIII